MMDLSACSHCFALGRYSSSWGVPGFSDLDEEVEQRETAARFSLGTQMLLLPCKTGTMSLAFAAKGLQGQ